MFIFFGYLLDVMFYDEMQFLFDPNTDVQHAFLPHFCANNNDVELAKKDGPSELSNCVSVLSRNCTGDCTNLVYGFEVSTIW